MALNNHQNPANRIPIKIGFVLLSNSKRPIPSTRIAVLNMFPFLRDANFDPHIVFEPEEGTETPELDNLAPKIVAAGFHIIYFQKVHGASVEKLAAHLSASGIKTVYGVCDLVNEPMATLTDATIVVTDFLKSLYPSSLQAKISVVHDGIEHPEKYKTKFNTHYGSSAQPLQAVLVTSAYLDRLPVINPLPDWLNVSIMGRYPRTIIPRFNAARWQFCKLHGFEQRLDYVRFLTNNRIKRLTWDSKSVYDLLQQADIGIIPIETASEQAFGSSQPLWKVKSENRLTMKMCVGLPVIATTIPSYQPVIEQGSNGFLANSTEEWLGYLNALRDPDLRLKMGERARLSVLEQYSKKEQAKRLISILCNLF